MIEPGLVGLPAAIPAPNSPTTGDKLRERETMDRKTLEAKRKDYVDWLNSLSHEEQASHIAASLAAHIEQTLRTPYVDLCPKCILDRMIPTLVANLLYVNDCSPEHAYALFMQYAAVAEDMVADPAFQEVVKQVETAYSNADVTKH